VHEQLGGRAHEAVEQVDAGDVLLEGLGEQVDHDIARQPVEQRRGRGVGGGTGRHLQPPAGADAAAGADGAGEGQAGVQGGDGVGVLPGEQAAHGQQGLGDAVVAAPGRLERDLGEPGGGGAQPRRTGQALAREPRGDGRDDGRIVGGGAAGRRGQVDPQPGEPHQRGVVDHAEAAQHLRVGLVGAEGLSREPRDDAHRGADGLVAIAGGDEELHGGVGAPLGRHGRKQRGQLGEQPQRLALERAGALDDPGDRGRPAVSTAVTSAAHSRAPSSTVKSSGASSSARTSSVERCSAARSAR
jgi:hypothetical protein